MADEKKMPETLETLATRIIRLEKSVDEAFVEQRKYTEFAFAQLDEKIDKKIDGLGSEMARRFNRLDRKLDVLLATPARPSSRRRRRT